MAVEPEDIVVLIAGTALAVLAVFVFAARPGGRLNRSFAVLLTCQSLAFLLLGIDNDDVASLAGRLRPYALIAIPFAAAYVAFQLLACYHATPLRRLHPNLVLAVVLLVGGACEVAYLLDHALFARPVATGFTSGPLTVFIELAFLVPALLALIFAFALRNNRLGLGRRSLWQAMTGFLLVPTYVGAFLLTLNTLVWLKGTFVPDPWQTAARVACLVAAGASLLVLARPGTVLEAKRAALLCAAAAGTAMLTASVIAQGAIEHGWVLHFSVYGLWSLASTCLLAAPILRDRILDVDHHVHWTFRRGALVSVVAAVLFAVMETLANWISDALSLTLGSLAAGMLLLAIHPLQRATDRLASGTLPRTRKVREMDLEERHRFYAEQAQIVWSDGVINPKERLMLRSLQTRLGLDAQEAVRLEDGILRA